MFYFVVFNSRAVGDRATEPRVAPEKIHTTAVNDHDHIGDESREMHLKKIKPKAETKPILQSLREGIEHLKKTTVRERSQTRQQNTTNGFLERITKLTHVGGGGGRNRNPAKKSASFTFAMKPEVVVRAKERYSSLEADVTSQNHSNITKQPVQRSISTSVLETPVKVELQPNYARVRDSLTPLPSPPKPLSTKTDDIYAEICETNNPINKIQDSSGSHVIARIKIIVKSSDSYVEHEEKEERYANSIVTTSQQMNSIISTEDEVIYNTIF